MKRWQAGWLAAVALGLGFWGGFARGDGAAKAADPSAVLLVHVGGTMRPAMEEICQSFEKATGIRVELNYNDSGSLMSTIETTGRGDACILHDPFPGAMVAKGLVDRSYAVASLTPVIVVKKGNPKGIAGVQDLARADVKVALTDALYSTAGHIVDVVFRKAEMSDAMANKEVVRARSGGEVANAVKIGSVDAAIVWDAVAFARKDALDAVAIDARLLPDPTVDAVTTATYGRIDMSCTQVVLMTLKGSRQLDAARKLGEWAASEEGLAVFKRRGFSPVPLATSGR